MYFLHCSWEKHKHQKRFFWNFYCNNRCTLAKSDKLMIRPDSVGQYLARLDLKTCTKLNTVELRAQEPLFERLHHRS